MFSNLQIFVSSVSKL